MMIRQITKSVCDYQKSFVRFYARRASSKFKIDRRHLPNDIEEAESDFMEVAKSHKMYEREIYANKEKINNLMIKNKYFKKKLPNFLTWSEKEQIRFLNQQDQNEWSLEKLSESFPADIFTISKIIKSKWYPLNEERIRKHDLSVKENWKMFKNNEFIDMDNLLIEHLKKFMHRNFKEFKTPHIDKKKYLQLHEPKDNEFSSIITGCKGYSEKQTQIETITKDDNTKLLLDSNANDKLNNQKYNSRPITLKHLKKTEVNKQDENLLIMEQQNNPNGTGNISISLNQTNDLLKIKKFNNSNVKIIKEDNLIKNKIRENIKIPKKLWKEGATYKHEDCFYDDDGEFLYRVPGMTGKIKNHN